jgi:hypothetical protein
MEHVERGFRKAATGLISGLFFSILVSSVFSAMVGDAGRNLAFLVNLASVMIGIVELERAKYWGLFYSLGYFSGLILLGQYLMESWELMIYSLIIGLFIAQKITRKIET